MTQYPLKGIHHVTAMTNDVERNYHFFTDVLGMRLVKKTVNQDDIYTYHTFFADDEGHAGTDMTFFDFPNNPKGASGTNSISRTAFRVPNDAALEYYQQRFDEFGVKHDDIDTLFDKKILRFEEEDGQKYQLISDENNTGIEPGVPWKNGPVPQDKAIYGLGPIEITVSYYDEFKQTLMELYDMKPIIEEENVTLLEVGKGGNGGQVILRKDEGVQSRPGYGQVHHVSFRVEDDDALNSWFEKYNQLGVGSSGIVDRFYFKALYTRIGHVLIELSTDGPGFAGDEPYETLGESLSLPPFLENQRDYIESEIREFDTTRS
ncbi:ring-cleaving dioxygenase [Staphylococcus coagulans]|uniref:ring-cleaving dioxygenase n=1 Tax=Staphylococcus coagulans TaxID=74706 RepID=UPI0029283ADE|nr:ring-cleaving dioxygenase [Staphylococcus coagulans]MDU9269085.1 ring-cleaving dioxygenase [Staphylococcus coagulans]MDU9281501.1 ring-cleaving dioxygenase [Staphylococcus coagulans]MDU9293383.1 ring-cleaving dioxygenase [Staphylococcus coagulans]MDU9305705.1 ring-cleaving dioxygenase [Staphylococcus coagulans]MDU9322821.1 ring-cleaving dioxygenase [Staphylococcus coagulans]